MMHFADAHLAPFSLKVPKQSLYLLFVEKKKKKSVFELCYSALNLYCPLSFMLLGGRGLSLLSILPIAITLHVEMKEQQQIYVSIIKNHPSISEEPGILHLSGNCQ